MFEYAVKFCTLAAASGWNEAAFITADRQGLSPSLRLHLAIYDDSFALENLIQRSIHVAQRLTACDLELPALHTPSATTAVAIYSPTQYHPAPAIEPIKG